MIYNIAKLQDEIETTKQITTNGILFNVVIKITNMGWMDYEILSIKTDCELLHTLRDTNCKHIEANIRQIVDSSYKTWYSYHKQNSIPFYISKPF